MASAGLTGIRLTSPAPFAPNGPAPSPFSTTRHDMRPDVAGAPDTVVGKEARRRLEILALGRNVATVNLEFKVRGQDRIGRQSQTWGRFPDLGWKVISAHVSAVDASALS